MYPEIEITNYLEYYSKKYNSVEIDQWFWSLFGVDNILLPKKSVVEEYNKSVPDNFKFVWVFVSSDCALIVLLGFLIRVEGFLLS